MTERDPKGEDLWERNAGWWQEGFTDGADPEYEEQILPLAAEHLAGARRVLDVGCGEGQISRLALRGGAELAVGVDPTWAQVEVAARRGGGAWYSRAGAGALPFRTGSFDAVLACLVFEHIRDVDDAIAEVARVLEPGGRFLFFLNHPLPQMRQRSHRAAIPTRPQCRQHLPRLQILPPLPLHQTALSRAVTRHGMYLPKDPH